MTWELPVPPAFHRLKEYFLARLTDAPPAIRAKAAVFLNVNAVIALMLTINVVVVEEILTRDHFSAVVETAWIAVIGIAFALLRKGRYAAASNLTIAVVLASLASLGYVSSVGGPLFSFAKLGFLLVPAIVYAFLVGAGESPPVWATVFSLLVLGIFFALRLARELPGGLTAHEYSWLLSSCLVIAGIGFMSHAASAIYLDAIAVSEQKARESRETVENLRRAGVRFRTIFDSINDAVFIQDPATGTIVDVNRKMTDLYGWTGQEAARMSVGQLSSNVPPYTQREADAWMAKARSGQTPIFEWQARAKDDRVFWVEVSMCRAEIDGQDRLLVSVRDIEQRKREESQRARLEDRLRQAEKMDAIGHLAGGIAHDFNNQLTGILGYAELLRLSVNDAESVSFAEHIVRASRRSSDLTRQLLAFARKGNYEIVPVNIHSLIDEVVALLERSIDKRISIRTDLAAGVPFVIGDPTQLQNALLNLAINARDAMPEGGELLLATKTFEVDAQARKEFPQLSLGTWLRMSVTDTGTGMNDETLRRLFEPFFTTKETGKGTGMGLASVYGTIQSHQGVISVDSKLGRGTTFEIDLPLAETKDVEKGPAARSFVRMDRTRVLVVDDEGDVRDLIRDMLVRAGCEVKTCQDGLEAVEHFVQAWREIDVVILDMMLPKMSGRDIFAALRRIDPAVKVLLASGYSLDGEAQALLDQGARGFLEKPFHVSTLLEKVEACARGAAGPPS
jgi:PAS domain S-box-containing protein